MLETEHGGSETQLGHTRSRDHYLSELGEVLDSEAPWLSSMATANNSSFVTDKRSDEDVTDYDEPSMAAPLEEPLKPKPRVSIMDFFGKPPKLSTNPGPELNSNITPDVTESGSGSTVVERQQVEIAGHTPDTSSIVDLENKLYGLAAKRVTAKDFLASFGSKSRKGSGPPAVLEPEATVVEEPVVIASSPVRDVAAVESKIYNESIQSMSARDYLMLKPKARTCFTTIKLPAWRLEEIAHPKPKTMPVTLHLPPQVLKQLSNPLFSRGTKQASAPSGQSANLLFKLMMERAAGGSRLTPIQKLKELEPPSIPRDSLHIHDESPADRRFVGLMQRSSCSLPSIEGDFFTGRQTVLQQPRTLVKSVTHFTDLSQIEQYITEKIPSIHQQPPFARILHQILHYFQDREPASIDQPTFTQEIVDLTQEDEIELTRGDACESAGSSLLWTDHFAPQAASDILIDAPLQQHLRSWVEMTLDKLRFQASASFKRGKRDSFDDFIDDTEPGEEPIYPIMILIGPHGCGKSSAVYAVAKEFNGYVHEVNTGQARGRKDIFTNIKEIATTHLVHRSSNQSKDAFQNGILLFEDCDILFEQDRTFWSVIHEAMDVTRRPIILTCRDLLTIPRNILGLALDANAILDFEGGASQSRLKDYVWLCGVSRGYDIDQSVLNSLDGSDLRLGLMSMQVLCNEEPPVAGQISLTSIAFERDQALEVPESLLLISSQLDALSVSDVLREGTKSQYVHSAMENEFVDQNIIDESLHLSLPSLPFETNMGEIIQDMGVLSRDHPTSSIHEIRREVTAFVASRSRKLTPSIEEFLAVRGERATRSLSGPHTWTPEPVGVDESSITFLLAPGPFVTDLFPVAQLWALFQISLDQKEAELLASNGISVKRFLRWRQFQHPPQQVLRLGLSRVHLAK